MLLVMSTLKVSWKKRMETRVSLSTVTTVLVFPVMKAQGEFCVEQKRATAVSATEFLITFTDVPEFGTAAGANNCQISLSATGTIEVRYGNVSMVDGMVGISAGQGANDLGGIDYSDLANLGAQVVNTGIGPFSSSMALAADNRPVLGTNWSLTTTGIDPISPVAITFFGTSGPAIPFTAIGIAAPGCDINLSTALGSLTGAAAGGSANVTLSVPNNPALAGQSLAAQSIGLTIQNAGNLQSSNGLEGTFGN